MLNKKIAILATSSLVIVSAVAAGAAQAQDINRGGAGKESSRGGMMQGRGGRGGMMPGARIGQGVVGKVTAISGSTITVQSGFGSGQNSNVAAEKTFTVDAGKATFAKMGAFVPTTNTNTPPTKPVPTTIAITDIVVGDMISVRGTVNGTNIAATAVTVIPAGMGEREGTGKNMVVGKVQSVSGTTLTVLGNSGLPMMGRGNNTNTTAPTQTTYTVDASSATVKKYSAPSSGSAPTSPVTIKVSDIVVGDTVRVQGTIDGTSVKATSIMDGVMTRGQNKNATSFEERVNSNPNTAALKAEVEAAKPGLWNKLMGFFSGLFGKHK